MEYYRWKKRHRGTVGSKVLPLALQESLCTGQSLDLQELQQYWVLFQRQHFGIRIAAEGHDDAREVPTVRIGDGRIGPENGRAVPFGPGHFQVGAGFRAVEIDRRVLIRRLDGDGRRSDGPISDLIGQSGGWGVYKNNDSKIMYKQYLFLRGVYLQAYGNGN